MMLHLCLQYRCLLMRREREKSDLLMDIFFCVFFLLSSLCRLSSVSVVFDFNDSLSDVAPASPILSTVDDNGQEKSELLMDVVLCVFFLLPSLSRLSFVSVVLNISNSLNDVAPESPMSLPVDVKRKK